MLEIPKLEEITFINGSYKKLIFYIEDNDGKPLDLSGCTIRWELSRFGDTDNPLITKTNAVGDGVAVSGLGEFLVELFESDTQGLKGKFIHTPVIIQGGGRVHRPIQGYIVLN